MRILDRYISRRFLANLGFALFAFAAIFVVVDLVEHMDKFIDREVPTIIIVKYYLYYFPFICVMSLPVAVLLASLFCTGQMSKHNELVAIKATGSSLYRILLPMLSLGVLISLFSLVISEIVAPEANRRKKVIRHDYVEKHDFNIRRRMTNLIIRDRPDRRIIIRYYDAKNMTANRVSIQEYRGPSIVGRADAPSMRWEADQWTLLKGFDRKFDGKAEQAVKFDRQPRADLTFTPQDLERVQLEPEEMSYAELREFIAEVRRNGGNTDRWEVDFHLKFAFPFSNLIIVLIGGPLAASKRRSGTAVAFGISLVVCFLYFGLVKTGQSLGHTGTLPPLLGAWLGNIVFLGIGGVLLAKTRT